MELDKMPPKYYAIVRDFIAHGEVIPAIGIHVMETGQKINRLKRHRCTADRADCCAMTTSRRIILISDESEGQRLILGSTVFMIPLRHVESVLLTRIDSNNSTLNYLATGGHHFSLEFDNSKLVEFADVAATTIAFLSTITKPPHTTPNE